MMTVRQICLVISCFGLLSSQIALAQDANKYHGGSYDGHATVVSAFQYLTDLDARKYYGGSYDGYAVTTSASDISLPVMVSNFTATTGDGGVMLRWTTESEAGNLGFHIYRAMAEEGPYQRLTLILIQGAGTSPTQHKYTFTDSDVIQGVTYWYKVEDVSIQGERTMHGPLSVKVILRPPDMAVREAVPTRYALFQNTPNPFNPVTAIAYDLPQASDVTLAIYTLTGQKVATLVSGHREPGHNEVIWNGSGFANGIYFYRLEAGGLVETRKMVLVK